MVVASSLPQFSSVRPAFVQIGAEISCVSIFNSPSPRQPITVNTSGESSHRQGARCQIPAAAEVRLRPTCAPHLQVLNECLQTEALKSWMGLKASSEHGADLVCSRLISPNLPGPSCHFVSLLSADKMWDILMHCMSHHQEEMFVHMQCRPTLADFKQQAEIQRVGT